MIAAFIEMDFVHKGTHQQNTAATYFFKIFRIGGIGEARRIEPLSMVPDHHGCLLGREFNFDLNFSFLIGTLRAPLLNQTIELRRICFLDV